MHPMQHAPFAHRPAPPPHELPLSAGMHPLPLHAVHSPHVAHADPPAPHASFAAPVTHAPACVHP